MKPFGQWLNDLTKDLQEREPEIQDVPEELTSYCVGNWVVAYDGEEYEMRFQGKVMGTVDPELVQENWGEHPGSYFYPCKVCDLNVSIVCDPWEWDPDYHYCGRSPSCCP